MAVVLASAQMIDIPARFPSYLPLKRFDCMNHSIEQVIIYCWWCHFFPSLFRITQRDYTFPDSFRQVAAQMVSYLE